MKTDCQAKKASSCDFPKFGDQFVCLLCFLPFKGKLKQLVSHYYHSHTDIQLEKLGYSRSSFQTYVMLLNSVKAVTYSANANNDVGQIFFS